MWGIDWNMAWNIINDAEAYLYTCIRRLKVALEKCYEMEEKRAAKQ